MLVYLFRKLLQVIFAFDKWHLNSSLNRSYCVYLISYLNNRKSRSSIVEIGCGLGDIINNIDYKIINGFDIDINVLKAATIISFINKRKIVYKVFNFPKEKLSQMFDVILMVNWIHHIEAEVLKNEIEYYFNNNIENEGAIIVDTVLDTEYKYNHDIFFLTKDLSCKIDKIGQFERGRILWAINKI